MSSLSSKAHQKSGSFPPPALPSFVGRTTLSDSRSVRRQMRRWSCELQPKRASPDYPSHPSSVPCHIPRRTERVRASIASPFTRPSPLLRRVGVRIFTFEACSGFTRVTARWIAQPPKAAFVTRLQPGWSPNQAARQLPDRSTTLWVEPSSTGVTRLRGALSNRWLLIGRLRWSISPGEARTDGMDTDISFIQGWFWGNLIVSAVGAIILIAAVKAVRRA